MNKVQNLSIINVDHFIRVESLKFDHQYLNLECKTTLHVLYKGIDYSFAVYFEYLIFDNIWEVSTKKIEKLDFSEDFKAELLALIKSACPPLTLAYNEIMKVLIAKMCKSIYEPKKEFEILKAKAVQETDMIDYVDKICERVIKEEYELIDMFLLHYEDECKNFLEYKKMLQLKPTFQKSLEDLPDKLNEKVVDELEQNFIEQQEFERDHRNL